MSAQGEKFVFFYYFFLQIKLKVKKIVYFVPLEDNVWEKPHKKQRNGIDKRHKRNRPNGNDPNA